MLIYIFLKTSRLNFLNFLLKILLKYENKVLKIYMSTYKYFTSLIQKQT